MSKKEKLINMLIDKHYNEANNNTLDKSVNTAAFENKMNAALEKMDLADNLDFNINIDTLKIIQQAEQIQTKRNSFKENIYFIITSLLILSIFSIILIKFDINFIIYFQLLLVFIMPWSLIPLAKHALRRNQNG